MSTRSTPSKSKTTSKSTSKSSAKSTTKTKSRLAGPKPPKARGASGVDKTVSKPVTATQLAEAKGVKPRTSKIPAPDMAAKPAQAPDPSAAEMKKPELIDLVVARSDVKKKYAKPVIEAMHEVLGETVAKGRELNLQPMGKVKYNRTKETTSARVVVAKIRQNKSAGTKTASVRVDKLADAAE